MFQGGRDGSSRVSASGGIALRSITAAAAISLLALASFGTVLVFEIPHTSDDAMQYAEGHAGDPGGSLTWLCPSSDGSYHSTERIDPGITQQDFERSMSRDVMRLGTVFVPAPVDLIDPDDIHVRKVAEHILSRTEGYSDKMRATAALWFVQTSIRYTSDQELYGCSEFWATPLETLYLHRGDCEDTSVLLCSLYLAMGLDCVLLDYDGHEAVGVSLGTNPDDLWYCETASDINSPLWGYCPGDPDVYVPGQTNVIFSILNNGIASYRNIIQRVAGT